MKRDLLLDTNAYSDFMRGLKWKTPLSTAKKVYIPLIVVGELRSGFQYGNQLEKNESILQRFLSQKEVKLLLPDFETTHHYSLIFKELMNKGMKIPQNDLWIAALCAQHGLWLCTSDIHFDHIPQLLRASS